MPVRSHHDGLNLLNDPKLHYLANVIDAGKMAGHFNQHLHASGLDSKWEVTHCAIERVYYRPTMHCGVLYRLTFRDPDGTKADEWFFGRMLPHGNEDVEFEKAAAAVRKNGTARNFLWTLLPVSFWRDLNMVLWIFPQDPKIPGLADVVDPAFVREHLEANLETIGVPVPTPRNRGSSKTWRCTDIHYDRIKYMPGKRCVLRYKATLTGIADQSREVTFYSKTYNDGMSKYHFEFLQNAHQQLLAQNAAVNIPRPLLHFAGSNTSWHEEWKGASLISELENSGFLDEKESFSRIATTLAALHSSRISGLRRGPDVEEVLMTASEDAAKLSCQLPQHHDLVTTILDHLTEAKNAVERQMIPTVPIHGACRLEQMLMRDTELALVDFDALASGDPLFDIAEFVASLQYLEFSHGGSRTALAKAQELLLESYASAVKWPCDRRRLAWYVLAFLISKVFASVKHLDIPALQKFEAKGEEVIYGWLEST